MCPTRKIEDSIKILEYELAVRKAIFAAFPDAKDSELAFSSKSVNKIYSKFDFIKSNYGLWVAPYCEINFEYNGKIEIIKVKSSPKSCRLAYLIWDSKVKEYRIKFSRLNLNLKTNSFKEDMLNACRVEILSFIKNNSKYKLDTKYLDHRLKKLLVFT